MGLTGNIMLCSDTHLGSHPEFSSPWKLGCNNRLQDGLAAVHKIVELCQIHNCRTLIHLGDLFHSWRAIYTNLFSIVCDEFRTTLKQADLHMLIVPGNHDLTDKRNTSVSTLHGFRGWPNITVVMEPTTMEIEGRLFFILPYHEDFDRQRAVLSFARRTGATLLGHLDLEGAEASIDGYTAWDGIGLPDLDGFTGGYLGHYHRRQTITNTWTGAAFTYVGSPYQIHKIEENQTKGILLLEENAIATPLEIDSPRFVSVSANTDPASLRPQDYHLLREPHSVCSELIPQWRRAGLHVNSLPPKGTIQTLASIKDLPDRDSNPLRRYTAVRPPAGVDLDCALAYGNYYLEEAAHGPDIR